MSTKKGQEQIAKALRKAAAAASAEKAQSLAALGKSLRSRDAYLRSGWDTYPGAIEAARAGDTRRLVDLLRGRRPLAGKDDLSGEHFDYFDELADYVVKRPAGRQLDQAVHEAAQIAQAIMGIEMPNPKDPSALSLGELERGRSVAIKTARELTERKYDVPVDDAKVHELLRRPKSRRRPKTRR
jgi:hypothetical protein